MKRILFLLLFLTTSLFASQPLKMGVMTDTHYLSEKLMDKGYAIQQYVYNSGRDMIDSPEILDQVIADYLASDIEVLLVCGDMVKDGEKQSHIDFVEKLKPLKDKGVKIFVVPGNHDIRFTRATRYQGNKTFDTESTTSPQDFKEIYADCGYNNAIRQDTTSLSYVAELDDSSWLLAIDAALYDQKKGSTPSGGQIKPETEQWIVSALSEAKGQDKRVIAMMHWNVTEHLPFQAIVFPNHIISDHARIASLLADNGVEVIFTGHFHSNDISAFTSEAGNTIYDIETGALISYPFSYRLVELQRDELKVKTRNIASVPGNPNLVEESKKAMKRLSAQNGLPLLKSRVTVFGEEDLQQFAEIASELYLLHLYGDEVVPDSLRVRINAVFEKNGFPVDESISNMEIDFPPADNNVVIKLTK